MNINLAKTIDYWLGIPVCWVLSAFYKARKVFTSNKNEETKPKKIIFMEFSEIGSTVLASLAMNKVKETYPDSEIYFWTFEENRDIAETLNIAPQENIVTIRSKSLPLLFIDTLKSIRRVRREGIDAVVDMELFSRFSSILAYLSAAKVRVGFHRYELEGLYRGDLHTHKVSYNPYSHISENFISLVDSFKAGLNDIPLLKKPGTRAQRKIRKINVDEEGKEVIWRKIEAKNKEICRNSRIVVIHFNVDDKLNIRRWPLEYYSNLIERMTEFKDVFVVIAGVGSGSAGLFSEYKRCINLTGQTTIRGLLSLFSIARALISYDSGIVHIASLSDIHTIALFGPETPLLYEPLTDSKKIFYKEFTCSPCLCAYNYRKTVCEDNKCMKAITVDEVYNEVVKVIK